MKIFSMLAFAVFFLTTISVNAAQGRLCMEKICIGDDIEQLDLEWKPIKVSYKANRSYLGLLGDRSVEELYYEYNESLIGDKKTLDALGLPIIQLQKFDSEVLENLAKVRAICSPLSLTGEVENNSRTKLFVTFRVVADNGGRGRLRVVQLEKEFNIFPPHLRPNDKEKYVALVETLEKEYPGMVLVRDIDARALSNEVAFADSVLGYRFISDVNNPLIFKVKDLSDLESIEYDENRSPLCPEIE